MNLRARWNWLLNEWNHLGGSQKISLTFEGVILVATTCYAVIALLQWGAMKRANSQTAENFIASQRPYVSVGKRDGTIGGFVDPTDAKGKVAVVLYFHNGGNLPASRFNVQLFAAAGPSRVMHMARLKNKAMDMTVYVAGLKDIARDSDNTEFFPNWISQADVMSARAGEKPISLDGLYEYCDAFGEYVCHEFTVNFDAASNGFNLLSTRECSYEYPAMNPTLPAELEYLPPCPNPNEQKQQQSQTEHYMEIGRPSPIPAWHAPTASATSK